jgi:hypothetical protein
MTKNGKFCAALTVGLSLLSLVSAVAGSEAAGWFGAWLILVSVFALIGATAAAFAAIGDYLVENEE